MSQSSITGDVATFTGGDAEVAIPAIEGRVEHKRRPGGWYVKLVGHYLKRNAARVRPEAVEGETAVARARSAVRWACVKSALSGAAAGTVSTGATIFTAETEGIGGIIAGPIAALAIGSEMILRAVIHVGLSCEIASI